MSDHNPRRTNRVPQPKYYPPPPVAVPRSQYANAMRASAHRPMPGPDPPRYFSSPFRAPLNPQERHDSFVEHQRSISEIHDGDESLPRPHFTQQVERDSYTFFERGPTTDDARPSQRSKKEPPNRQKPAETSQSSLHQPGVVRQASIGHRVKPALTDVRRSDSTQTSKPYSEPQTPPSKADTIEALNAAIAAAIKHTAHQSTTASVSRDHGNVRALCDSPTSTYSQDLYHSRKSHIKSQQAFIDQGRVVHVEQEPRTPSQAELDKSSPVSRPTPYSEKSTSSTNPLLGLGIAQRDVHSRVPEDMRPPRLNMKAVHDMESRGSITSLPDLIRRATRLAANLDRGKTASRLGMWDMFSNTDHATTGKRESTFTEVLNSFPEPKNATPSKAPRPTTMWPIDPERVTTASRKEGSRPSKSPRTCCGLSMMVFVVVAVIVVILIAAAIIIPVFLVAVPRESRASEAGLGNCAVSLPCQNGGISVVDNNACSCVCVGGFTGHNCSKYTDQNCVTANLVNADQKFENVTLGSLVRSLLVDVQGQLKIPLNVSAVLAAFSSNSLSCAAENSLVQFDATSSRRNARFVIVPELRAEASSPMWSTRRPSHKTLAARETTTAVRTSDGIVYQTAQSELPPTQSSATAVSSLTTTAIPGSTSSTIIPSVSASPTPSPNNTTTLAQRNFAGLVVLYVLAESRASITAVTAQRSIEQYFSAGGLASGNKTIDVIAKDQTSITANFENLAIVLSDGRILGGTQ